MGHKYNQGSAEVSRECLLFSQLVLLSCFVLLSCGVFISETRVAIMGSNDVPPPHVPSHVVPICSLLLQVGGALWTLCYILMLRQSRRTRTYGMPLFVLAMNFSWEIVYALYVVETGIEFTVFGVWLAIDCGLVYYMLKFGKQEWSHAPFVERNLGTILAVMVVYCSLGHYAFAKWWIDNNVGKREGKFYRGVIGPDTTELGFWSSSLAQAYLGVASLAQLLIRQHSGGVSWGVWYVGCSLDRADANYQ